MRKIFIQVALLTTFLTVPLLSDSIVKDYNGDGQVIILAFGDSITFGTGDSDSLGGYPARLEVLLGTPVDNEGDPGEMATGGGKSRFPGTLARVSADVALIFEGTNDAATGTSINSYREAIQSMINYSVALNSKPILVRSLTPCCDHAGRQVIINEFNNVIEELAVVNDLEIVQLDRVWDNTCSNPNRCEFYNLPEGLHPNRTGYDLIAHTMAAALLDINVLVEGGAANLDSALGLPEGTVFIKPSTQ